MARNEYHLAWDMDWNNPESEVKKKWEAKRKMQRESYKNRKTTKDYVSYMKYQSYVHTREHDMDKIAKDIGDVADVFDEIRQEKQNTPHFATFTKGSHVIKITIANGDFKMLSLYLDGVMISSLVWKHLTISSKEKYIKFMVDADPVLLGEMMEKLS